MILNLQIILKTLKIKFCSLRNLLLIKEIDKLFLKYNFIM